MTRRETLAECVIQSRGLMMRYVAGFTDATRTVTAPNLPNHLAWILGHCAMTMHRAAAKIDGRAALDEGFVVDDTRGDGNRFGTESVAFGSDPTNSEVNWPPLGRCVEIFSLACDRLARALIASDEAKLDEFTPFFGGVSLPRWNVAPRMVFHNGTHCGQLADLRRALGMPSIFG